MDLARRYIPVLPYYAARYSQTSTSSFSFRPINRICALKIQHLH